jgi:hypothetical protein
MFFLCCFLVHQIQAQQSFWKAISEKEGRGLMKGQALFGPSFTPYSYKVFTLQTENLKQLIRKSPLQNTVGSIKEGILLEMPVPDGSIETFRILEAPVMVPALQGRYSFIRSYTGKGVKNPARTIRCDISQIGFHATVSTVGEPTYYINPLNAAKELYAVYARNPLDRSTEKFSCSTADIHELTPEGTELNRTTFVGNADDGFLRTFRLALCVTGKWSQGIMTGSEVTTQDSINTVMANIVAYLVRANEVYERDLGIRLIYVDNQDTLIFLNPATDPFGSLNSTCQKTCDARIGDANYDIGHVIDKAPANGNAGCIGCVCTTGKKGSGFTQYNNLSLVDYFVIDYWTHEMGHQVGGNHTFTHSSENTSAQIETGSGSTIMGYAGITGSTDVQPHSDDLFSTASIAQISINYKNNLLGGKCAVKIPNGNNAPVVNAGLDYIVPALTPFVLTGAASDPDAGDVLSYVWEQIDVRENPGFSSIPKASNTKGPMMRTYNYTSSLSRTIPDIYTVLAGLTSTKFEVLPSVARDLNFRFTARDNHFNGGQNESDNMLVQVEPSAGPFKITTANTSIGWNEGDVVEINWDVANTNLAPINVTEVNILLSLDGGLTFPIKLTGPTPNDGSELVTIPLLDNELSDIKARIKVEAIGNIFFDINDANISIDNTLPVSWLGIKVEKSGPQAARLQWSTAYEFNNNYFDVERGTEPTKFSSVGRVPAGTKPTTEQQYTYTDLRLPMGTFYYRIKQVDKDGKFSYSSTVQVTIDANGANWTLLPNPATDKASILFNKSFDAVSLHVADANGKIIFTKALSGVTSGSEFDLSVKNWSDGIYQVKIVAGGQTEVRKLVVLK